MIGGIEMIIGVKFCFEVFIVVSIWLMEPGIGSDSFFKMDEISKKDGIYVRHPPDKIVSCLHRNLY